jgi:hypothetical protein
MRYRHGSMGWIIVWLWLWMPGAMAATPSFSDRSAGIVLRLTFIPGSELDYAASLEKILTLAHQRGVVSLDATGWYPEGLDAGLAAQHRDFLEKQLDYIQHMGRLYHVQIRRSLQRHGMHDRIVLAVSPDRN